MRPSQTRLQAATYPFSTQIATRFGDMDALRHLNNVALAGVYEEARLRFGAEAGVASLREPGHRLVVGEVEIRYIGEGRYPAPLDVGVGLTEIGRSSYRLGLGMFQEGRCIGVCDTVLVYVNVADARARPLPDGFRVALQAHALSPTPN